MYAALAAKSECGLPALLHEDYVGSPDSFEEQFRRPSNFADQRVRPHLQLVDVMGPVGHVRILAQLDVVTGDCKTSLIRFGRIPLVVDGFVEHELVAPVRSQIEPRRELPRFYERRAAAGVNVRAWQSR